MFESQFRERLVQLRMDKGVSARDMSLSMGQSEGYINKIEVGHSLPSLTGFFYICEYFQITPKEFFDYSAPCPAKIQEILQALQGLNTKQLENILAVIKDIRQ